MPRQEEVVRERIRFVGRVQGVGFRASARAVARGFAVTGWVRNEPDGSVLLEVQGPPGEVERFRAALLDQMAGFIRSHNLESCAARPEESGFEIRH